MHAIRHRAIGLVAVLATGVAARGATQSMSNMSMSRSAMSASDLRVALNTLLAEHIYLAGSATGAALAGRTPEFQAAAGALDSNSVALSKAIGMIYGDDAGTAFLALWRKHIGFVVDYTTGVATKNKMKQDKAVQDLLGYANDFGAFLHSACPGLPTTVVADLVRGHITSLKTVIDAQAAKDPAVYSNIRMAAAHMQMIADPLAAAIAKQFPERFASR
jgi:hypothetical protein